MRDRNGEKGIVFSPCLENEREDFGGKSVEGMGADVEIEEGLWSRAFELSGSADVFYPSRRRGHWVRNGRW
jgi:hypothetical protein